MNKIKFFYLSNDTTFKYLFNNNKTRSFFDELISYYTHLDISKFHFMNNEESSGNNYVSYKLDSLLTNEDNNIIVNVELNREYKDFTELRNRRYLHTIASKSINNKYNDKRIVIQLNLNCYESRERNEISTETFKLRDIDNDLVIDDFIIYNVFIPKELDLCYNLPIKNKLQLFLCDTYEKMRDIVNIDKELKTIVDELERLNNDKYFGALYDAEEEQEKLINSAQTSGFREGKRIGLQEGHDIGLQEGLKEKTNEIVIKMINENCDIDLISKVTNLSIEEIKKILENKK